MARFYAALLAAVAAQLEAGLGGGGSGGGSAAGAAGALPDAAPAPFSPFGLAMVDELLADSFLRALFCRFYEGLAEEPAGGLPPVPAAVQATADRLAAVVEGRLGWRLGCGGGQGRGDEDEDEDDGPVVVDEHGNY
jgi:hypothetical protein